VPLAIGSIDPYYTDDIGNVSTSRFRSTPRESLLELKPRFPVFGGWQYKFRIGWNNPLSPFLRRVSTSEGGYVLRVPFLEGPKMPEGVQYQHVSVRIILPEGATNVKFQTGVALVGNETSLHKTFMDTLGRTALKLTAVNVVDESRDAELIVRFIYFLLGSCIYPLAVIVRFSLANSVTYAGHIRIPLPRRLPETLYNLRRRLSSIRDGMGNWEH
jgi:oligosaccharyltransferase complex subunit alpha (ribophorin I)